MKKAITSFGTDYHSSLLSLSIKTLYMYAYNHNYDLFFPSNNFFSDTTKIKPPSWWKLDVIENLLKTYEQVLWIDSDVIICRFENDIANEMDQNSTFGLVVHETSDGWVPNCGVWFLNQSFLEIIPEIKSYTDFRRSGCWWEQASLIYLMGTDPDSTPIIRPKHTNIQWTSLDYRWNPHINDHRKIPPDTKFFHSTCFPDRYQAMSNILAQIG